MIKRLSYVLIEIFLLLFHNCFREGNYSLRINFFFWLQSLFEQSIKNQRFFKALEIDYSNVNNDSFWQTIVKLWNFSKEVL